MIHKWCAYVCSVADTVCFDFYCWCADVAGCRCSDTPAWHYTVFSCRPVTALRIVYFYFDLAVNADVCVSDIRNE